MERGSSFVETVPVQGTQACGHEATVYEGGRDGFSMLTIRAFDDLGVRRMEMPTVARRTTSSLKRGLS